MKKMEEREAVTLINKDEKIFSILHRPLSTQKGPAILICSGFAGNKCGKFRLFVRLAEELAKIGITVLRFDYRGAGDSEGDFQDITIEGKVSDTLKCLQFLAEHPLVDPTRIGLLGRSLGGAIALLAAKRFVSIKSVALWAPVFDSSHWLSLWNSLKENQLNTMQKQEMQNFPIGIPNLQFLQEFFKLKLEEELNALKDVPLLHIEAEYDKIVKAEHGKGYRMARQKSSKTKFVQLPNSDHDFSDLSDQKVAIQETCQWFQETI